MAEAEVVGRTAELSTKTRLSTTAALLGAAGTLEHADEGPPQALSLPDELLAARDRVVAARARTSRAATRRRSRHRLGTVSLVGSAVLATVAITEGYARTHLPGVADATAGGAAAPSTARSTANLSTLGGISRVLAADQQLIASLVKTENTIASRYAAAARAAGTSQAATDGAASGSVAASGAAPQGTSPATSLPPLPALPPVPAVSAPAAHATTGASSVP